MYTTTGPPFQGTKDNPKSPLVFCRAVPLPAPPDDLINPMDRLEILPDDIVPESNEGLVKVFPSIIDNSVFQENAPSVELEPRQVPSAELGTPSFLVNTLPPPPPPVPKGVVMAGIKPTPYETMEYALRYLVLCTVDEKLYAFAGICYRLLSPEGAQRLILEHCRDYVRHAGTPGHLRQVYDLLLLEPRLQRQIEEIPHHLVCFQNGLLNLQTGELQPHSPNVFVTHPLQCSYLLVNSDCPVFRVFLEQVTGGDPLLIQRILECIGYCLTSDQAAKAIFLLQGVGDSGKSLFSSLLGSFFLSEDVSPLDIHALGERFALSDLDGKALCLSPDLPSGRLSAEATSVLKKCTGSDLLSADVKYSKRTKFRCSAKFILSTNHPLIPRDSDIALLDRLVTIPFRYAIPKEHQDPLLLTKLKAERDAIAYLAMQAYFNLVRNKYRFSGHFEINAVVAAEDDSSSTDVITSIYTFAATHFCKCPGKKLFTEDIHIRFEQEFFSIPINAFSAHFTKAIYQIHRGIKKRDRRTPKSNPVSCYYDIDYV